MRNSFIKKNVAQIGEFVSDISNLLFMLEHPELHAPHHLDVARFTVYEKLNAISAYANFTAKEMIKGIAKKNRRTKKGGKK